MSSRALRKKQQELSAAQESDSSDSDDYVTQSNPFDLLEAGQPDSDEDEPVSQPEPAKPATKQPQQSQKQKAGKRKGKAKDDEDFDSLISQFVSADIKTSGATAKAESQTSHLLQPSAKYLNPNAELKEMFGAGALGPAPAAGAAKRGHGRTGRAQTRPSIFVRPRETWPPVTSDLDMALVETKDRVNYFKFNWGESTKEAQRAFFMCVQTGDPNTLARLLQRFPYHPDTLLQLYEALKITGQTDSASDLLERVLYRFETALHSKFDVKQANSRLLYKNFENRAFYLAFFTRIETLGRRGCVKSALELSKLLLSFDMSDPLGVLNFIDHFALRAKSYAFLLQLFDSGLFEEQSPQLLPNFLFSTALAKFYFEQSDSSKKSSPSSGDLLQTAILTFPQTFVQLLDKSGRKDLTVAHQGRTITVWSFEGFKLNSSVALTLASALFVERNGTHLWKDEKLNAWIKAAATVAVERSLAQDPLIASYQALAQDHYSTLPESLKRHVLLSETANVTNLLPQDVATQGFRIYEADEEIQQRQQQQQQQQATGLEANPLFQFFRTLLPFGGGQQPAQPAIDPALAQQLFGDMDEEDQEGLDDEFDE